MTATTPERETEPTGRPTTMHAMVADRYGPAGDVLEMRTVGVPEIADDEVLVRVQAAGVDRGTWHLLAGLPYLVRPVSGMRRPTQPVPGLDLAGVVEAVGANVTRFRPGDEVFGIGSGSFAEYAPAKEAKLAHKPERLSFEQAAAVPVSGLTALQAARDVGRVQAGQHVLILGASGGVGSYAVQVAKALGAEVTAVASTAKLDLVRSLGADHVVDYTQEDITDQGRRYDVILDIGGNRPLRTLRRALAADGTLVIVGGENGGRLVGGTDRQLRALLVSPFVSQRLTTFVSKERSDHLEDLAELIEAGSVTPSIDRTFPLADAAQAVAHLEQGRARGKVVLTV